MMEEPSYSQSVTNGINNVKWKVAMKEEMDALEKNKIWNPVELPKDEKVVGCK